MIVEAAVLLVAGVSLATAVILQRNGVTVNKGSDRVRGGTVRYTGKGQGQGQGWSSGGLGISLSRVILRPSWS